MNFTPSKERFVALAAVHSVVPVSVRVLADRTTPVAAFERFTKGDAGFLLESVEGGDRWARWSFVGWDPAFTLVSQGGVTKIEGSDRRVPDGDPLQVVESLLGELSTSEELGLPPLHSGAVGYLAYDAIRHVEKLPDPPPDDRGLPEMMWQFVGSLAAFDRFDQTATLIRNVYIGDDPASQYDDAVTTLVEAAEVLGAPAEAAVRPLPDFGEAPPTTATMDRVSYEEAVRRAIKYVEAGDVFQVVLSLRLTAQLEADPFDVYRALRVLNPSPYMFFIRHRDLTIAGSSPELMSRVRDGRVYSRPIAGTRPRGSSDAQDERLAAELLADPKERAEHVMLIDLARNDVGRVSQYGSVAVDDLMAVERYSHVMHLVSGVSGELRDGVGPIDVLRATFPHGTVSGAPKVRAMEIIDELEPVARGPYAGAVGYVDLSGNLDTAIALRTMVSRGGTAWVQAGAGIVADSDPTTEYEECRHKAAAVLQAIEAASHV